MAQTPHSGVALQLSRSRGAVHKPPHGVICSHKGWLQHFSAHFTSLKYYKGIPNSCPKLRLNLTFHFGCNFQTPQMFEKRTNIHTCLVLFFSLKFLPSLHLRTLLTITPDFIWASGLQKFCPVSDFAMSVLLRFTFNLRRCKPFLWLI